MQASDPSRHSPSCCIDFSLGRDPVHQTVQYPPFEELLVRQLRYCRIKVRVLHARKLLEMGDFGRLRRKPKSRVIFGVPGDKISTDGSRFKDNQIDVLQGGYPAERVEFCDILLVLRESPLAIPKLFCDGPHTLCAPSFISIGRNL